MKSFFGKNITKLSLAIIALSLIGAILFLLIPAYELFGKIISYKFNEPERVDRIVFKYDRYLLVFGIFLFLVSWLEHSGWLKKLKNYLANFLEKLFVVFTFKFLLFITIVYLAVLFVIASTHYDLGVDEAWYIYYAENFAKTGLPFYDTNGKITVIDNISMLPYYLFSVINFKLGLTDVFHFKILSSFFSVITLLVLFITTKKIYSKRTAVLFLLFLVTQPGWGFLASSFFGEILQAAFLFGGLYVWLNSANNFQTKKIILASVFFALAIHTKFQLLILLPASLIILHFTDKNIKAMRVLYYTLGLTLLLIIIRTIPVLFYDPKLLKNLILITDFLAPSMPLPAFSFMMDKIQLFNRFFPLIMFLFSIVVFSYRLKSAFDKFLLIFTSVSISWWILLYPLTTYRNPFMGIITLCLIIAILIERIVISSENKLSLGIKYLCVVCGAGLLLYGFSTNIIYAYIGYNDGVQFDLAGDKNRLFMEIKHDNTQREFNEKLKSMVVSADTLYNAGFVTKCYTDNPVSNLQKLKDDLLKDGHERFVLVTCDNYSLDLSIGRNQIDSIANKKLILKVGENELYKVSK